MPGTSVTIALDRFTTFGDLLRYLRRRTGCTQREFSIAVGYSDTQISRLEQNERMPDLATVTARFLPALHLEDQPEIATRLLELAASVRREDAPASGIAPYKGLYYFDEADAEWFFGRDVLTGKLVERLTTRLESDQRILAIVGASGSGKSSVVRAGLIPALRWQQPSSNWAIYVLTPTTHPLEALAAGLYGDIRQGPPVRQFVQAMAQDPQTLQQALQRSADDTATTVLIIMDQFEELFTLCRNEAEQASFIDNLLCAAFHPGGRAILVIVLRADFYAHCARFDLLRQVLAQHQEYIGPMKNEELRRAIEEPARRGHWEFEPGLVELLLHEVGATVGHSAEPGALPLLSHALLTTWQRRRGRMLTFSGYTATGGVRGAIAETAEAVFYDRLESGQRNIARQVFLRLTELGDDPATADTCRRVSFSELVSTPEDRETIHEVLSTLADARLVTMYHDTVEVAHEALIRAWPTLRGWLEDDRESLRLQRHLTLAAQEWDALGRDPGWLYRGARLAQAIEWAVAHPSDLNLLEQSFLDVSRALAEKEATERDAQRQRELEAACQLAETERVRAEEQAHANRRLRRQAVYLALALVIAGVLAVTALAFGQRAVQAGRLASSRELAAAGVNNLQVDPERSLLLALEALNQANTLEARNALHQALPEMHLLRTILAHPVGIPDIAYSPDGLRLASIGEDGISKGWDVGSGQELLALSGEPGEPGSSITFSPDGRDLATAWATRVTLWDSASGKKLFTLSGHSIGTTVGYNLGVGQISFSPDGSRLAVANMDGASKVWDLATQAELISLAAGLQPAKAIAYSPDGSRLATAGDDGIVKVWDASSGVNLLSLSVGGVIHSVAFDRTGVRLAAASEEGTVKVWQAMTGEVLLSLPRLSGLYGIAFLADGSLATAGQDGTARVWDSVFGQQLLTLAGPTSTVISVEGSPDGSRIATSAYDGSIRIWDAAPGREVMTILGHSGIIWDAAFSPDGQSIASVSADGTARLWDAQTGQLRLALSQASDPVDGLTGLAFSPDGRRIATGSMTGMVTLWDSATGEIQAVLGGHKNFVVGLAFSPDGTRLASASWDGTARVWDLAHGGEISIFTGHDSQALLTNIAFSPDGQRVFTSGTDKTVRLWEAATGQQVKVFSGEGKEIYGLALSADGNRLAIGSQDGGITVWDVGSGKKLQALSGHAGIVVRLAFDRDGARLASASFDKLARVWDVSSGEELFGLYGNLSNVFGVSFSPDGAHLVTAGADGNLRIYALQLDDLLALARARLTRGLALNECRKFLHRQTCP